MLIVKKDLLEATNRIRASRLVVEIQPLILGHCTPTSRQFEMFFFWGDGFWTVHLFRQTLKSEADKMK